MLYTPLLPEAASGTLEPRHVVVPLRQMCPHAELLLGRVTAIDEERRLATSRRRRGRLRGRVRAARRRARRVHAPCRCPASPSTRSGSRTSPMRSTCATTSCASSRPPTRRRISRGGGRISPSSSSAPAMRVSRRSPSSPTSSRTRSATTRACATRRSAGCSSTRRRRSCPRSRRGSASMPRGSSRARRGDLRRDDARVGRREEAVLSNGARIPTRTLVWTAGVRANPLLGELGLPLDERGRVRVDRSSASRAASGCGRSATAPPCRMRRRPVTLDPPTCQHALRQARRLAKNLTGEREPYRYRMLGQVATLGRYKGIADVLGVRLRGFVGWWVTRSYHLLQLPLLTRKLRVVTDWTTSLFFRRDIAELSGLGHPHAVTRRLADLDAPLARASRTGGDAHRRARARVRPARRAPSPPRSRRTPRRAAFGDHSARSHDEPARRRPTCCSASSASSGAARASRSRSRAPRLPLFGAS